MAGQTISGSQLHNLKSGSTLDLFLDSRDEQSQYASAMSFTDITNTMAYLGALYVEKLEKHLSSADATSSGALSKSIVSGDVKLFGSVYTVEISAAKYAKFLDEGVDGWAKSRGSQYKFKKSTRKRGTPFTGKSEFVENIKKYLLRESSFVKLGHATTLREKKQDSIGDASTKAAIGVAYMIKRQGIKPTHFWQDATKEMRSIVEKELGKALKIDIINAITA